MKTENELLREMIRIEEQRADAWKALAMELCEANRKLLAAPMVRLASLSDCAADGHEWTHDGSSGDWCEKCNAHRADLDPAYAKTLARLRP